MEPSAPGVPPEEVHVAGRRIVQALLVQQLANWAGQGSGVQEEPATPATPEQEEPLATTEQTPAEEQQANPQGLGVQTPAGVKEMPLMQALPGIVREQVPAIEQHAPSWDVQGLVVQVEPTVWNVLVPVQPNCIVREQVPVEEQQAPS